MENNTIKAAINLGKVIAMGKKYNVIYREDNVDDIIKRLVNLHNIPNGWDCKCCGKNCNADPKDYYMLKNNLWKKLHPEITGMLCMDCVEDKLGRKLSKNDILICP